MNENRVKAYYELALEYVNLPVTARFLIATHFDLVGNKTLSVWDEDEMDVIVFLGIAKKQLLPAFKRFVEHFKKSRGYEYNIN